VEKRKLKGKRTDKLRSIGKQPGESVESVRKKKRKTTVERKAIYGDRQTERPRFIGIFALDACDAA